MFALYMNTRTHTRTHVHTHAHTHMVPSGVVRPSRLNLRLGAVRKIAISSEDVISPSIPVPVGTGMRGDGGLCVRGDGGLCVCVCA
jgi:hypothetical protein